MVVSKKAGKTKVKITSFPLEESSIVSENKTNAITYTAIESHPCHVAGVQPQP